MSITSDPNDPGINVPKQDGTRLNESYLVLSEEERSKGFVRPLRDSYIHKRCGALTRINNAIAETYARDPKFYGSTYCVGCRDHFPVSQFIWDGIDQEVGS